MQIDKRNKEDEKQLYPIKQLHLIYPHEEVEKMPVWNL